MERTLCLFTLIALAVSGCATPDYQERDSQTSVAVDNTLRYGSIAGAGVGGYFAGQELGNGSVAAGVAGSVAGAGILYGLNKFIDTLRGRAYKNGKLDGAAIARAEILQEKWTREAVYGIHANGEGSKNTKFRRVYVPERTINGVKLAGGYQEVQVVYP